MAPERLSRRVFTAGAAVSVTGCDRLASIAARWAGGGVPDSFSVPDTDAVDADTHFLSRTSFGPRPGDRDELRRVGRERWLDAQLSPGHLDDWACDLRVGWMDTAEVDAGLAFEFPPEQIEVELGRSTLLRAVYSKRQLLEVVTEVWTDHFHVAIGKGKCRHLRSPYDREVLRTHALGRFRDLCGAATTSAAMLVYLDGAGNALAAAPNENHARELLELHTLGVGGGYTQRDVQEVARCLTGFVVEEGGARPGSVTFARERHDDAQKTVLGHTVGPGGGAADVERLLDILCDHPSTARRVATRLARAFVADDPPADLIDRAASAYVASGGDIAAVVRKIVLDDAFFEHARARIKRPFRLVASSLRATGADTHARKDTLASLGRMGHAPFTWPTPDGYPERGDAWLATMLERFRFALGLAHGQLAGASVPLDDLRRAAGSDDAVVAHVLGRRPSPTERAALDGAADLPAKLAITLASPGFQRF